MKKYTQEEFDTLPRRDGKRVCPTGDYSSIRKFPDHCDFGDGSIFATQSSFGGGCSFGAECRIGSMSSTGALCSFGKGCVLDSLCSFGAGCYFSEECSFVSRARFGKHVGFAKSCSFGLQCIFDEGHSFGEGCSFRGRRAKPGFPFLRTTGGSTNRTTLWFNLEGNIYVECGCFYGNLEEFRAKVRETHGDNRFAKLYLAQAACAEIFYQ